MGPKFIRSSIITFASVAVLYPLWMSSRGLNLAFDSTLAVTLFPLLGTAAFVLLWLHVVGPAFEPWLSRYVNFERFLEVTSPLILVLILLHPLLLLVSASFKVNDILGAYGAPYIVLGLIGLMLLLVFDIGEAFKRHNVIQRNWNTVLILSTAGFILIFFHSLGIGGSLQEGTYRVVWILYGVTAITAAIYEYVVKRFLN